MFNSVQRKRFYCTLFQLTQAYRVCSFILQLIDLSDLHKTSFIKTKCLLNIVGHLSYKPPPSNQYFFMYPEQLKQSQHH